MAPRIPRNILVYKNYFWDFYHAQKPEIQLKIDWVIGLVRDLPIIPEKYFKHLEGSDGLFEIRIKVGSNIFRVFCFYDEGNLVVLMNGFQKKTDKTPKQELERAERLKQAYYNEKSSR
ncbi:type II toxin-antitoxin system RelE/ParE family toxin [Spirosoma litoris]